MKKRSIIAVLLTMIMILSLCACGGGSSVECYSGTDVAKAEAIISSEAETVTDGDYALSETIINRDSVWYKYEFKSYNDKETGLSEYKTYLDENYKFMQTTSRNEGGDYTGTAHTYSDEEGNFITLQTSHSEANFIIYIDKGMIDSE